MDGQVLDGRYQDERVVLEMAQAGIAAIAQESADPTGDVIVIDSQVPYSSFVAGGLGASADRALAILCNEHRLEGRWGDFVVEHPHGGQSSLPMAVVISSLPGILPGPILRNRIVIIAILSEFIGRSGPPSLRWLRQTKDCVRH